MSIQQINNGDTGLKARNALNSIGEAAQMSLSGRTATIMGFGDSFAGTRETGGGYLATALRWARSYWAPGLDFRMIEGFNTGGSFSSALASQYDAYMAAGVVPDIAVVSTFQNDGTILNGYAARVAAFKTFVDNMLASGVKLLIITSTAPPENLGALGKQILNTELRNIVATTPGTAYCDLWGATFNPAAATSATGADGWKSAPNGVAWTVDGTHPSNQACKDWGKALADILSPILRRRTPTAWGNNLYDNRNIDTVHANIIRPGNFNGTEGKLNGVANSNVAGFSTSVGDHWNIVTTNGVVCTPSIITDSEGFRRQRMTLSGTVTSGQIGTLQIIPFVTGAGNSINPPSDAELYTQAVVDFDNVTGMTVIRGDYTHLDPSGTNPQTAMLPLSGRMFMFSTANAASNGFIDRGISFRFRGGETISGVIDVGQVGMCVTTPYVAP